MRFNEIDYKMFTLAFLFFLSMVFAIIGYLIKYLEQYQIIAGYTKDAVTKDKNLKKKAHLIAESLFVMAGAVFILTILNLFVDWFKIINDDLDGMWILLGSLIFSVIYYIVCSSSRSHNKV